MQGTRLGLIGYGEVGGIFCAGLKTEVDSVHAWDIKLADAAAVFGTRTGRRRCARRATW